MNFEDFELATLAYLKQTTNPLVRISALHAQACAKAKDAAPSIEEYTDFLRDHTEIKVMDPLAMAQDDKTAHDILMAGFKTNLCAIHTSRVPSSREMAAAMLEQLDAMTHALTLALKEARAIGDEIKGRQIYNTLERTAKMKEKVAAFTKAH